MGTAALSPYAWKESYSVGVALFDGQHKYLIGLIAKLQDAMYEGRGRDAIGQTLAALSQYSKIHFAAEERLLGACDYLEFDQHKAEHDHLTAKVHEFQSRFASGQIALTVQMMQFLRDWLVNHILGADRKYALFLSVKGVR